MRTMITNLNNNYVTPRLQGRTGNIMFEVAHAYAQSLEHNRQLVVPSKESSTAHQVDTLYRKVNFDIEVYNQTQNTKEVWAQFHYTPVTPAIDRPSAFCGYYQSEKYFGKYKEAVRDLFSPPLTFIDKALKEYPFFKTGKVAAINVRRGDYLQKPNEHPVVTVEYINEAYSKLPPHETLLVMSDDPKWCKENIDLPNMVISDNTKFWDEEGLWLLSLCDHFIISNSTFSWWGAWLSRSENKTVIAPQTWFGPLYDNYNPKDIYCEGWIQIPTYWDNGFIKLKK
jgi:hypothetical protein